VIDILVPTEVDSLDVRNSDGVKIVIQVREEIGPSTIYKCRAMQYKSTQGLVLSFENTDELMHRDLSVKQVYLSQISCREGAEQFVDLGSLIELRDRISRWGQMEGSNCIPRPRYSAI